MTEAEVKAKKWTKVQWPWNPMGEELCNWSKGLYVFRCMLTDAGETYVVLQDFQGNALQLWSVE